MKIHNVSINNFKSIRELKDFELRDINVFIGSNGAGKSNFISFFKFLQQIVTQNLQFYTAKKGGADNFLYFGRKVSSLLALKIVFNIHKDLWSSYNIELEATDDDKFILKQEVSSVRKFPGEWQDHNYRVGIYESYLGIGMEHEAQYKNGFKIVELTTTPAPIIKQIKIYHFHDTSDSAYVKGFTGIEDNRELREDASNLAAFLYILKKNHLQHFLQIEKAIRRIAPFFDRFNLEESQTLKGKIRIEWFERGSDKQFTAHHLSDGTLRMICLATLLLQPKLPYIIIIDEPELGLHPSALGILSGLISIASQSSQIIIATQSTSFVSQFNPEHIVVVEHEDNQSTFKRLDAASLDVWLEDYTLGEIWEKNLIGGRP